MKKGKASIKRLILLSFLLKKILTKHQQASEMIIRVNTF